MSEFKLYNNDCLKVLDELIEQNIMVDSVICDPPYGTTACEWDLVIPESELIPRLYKVIKPNGWLILFGNSPFYDKLLVKATDKYDGKQLFKYSQEMIWEKHAPTNPLAANSQLMRKHEKVMILTINKKESGKHQTYNPYTKTYLGYNKPLLTKEEKGLVHIIKDKNYSDLYYSDEYDKKNIKRKLIDLNNMDCLKHTNAYKKSSDQLRGSIEHLADEITKTILNNVERERERDVPAS